MFFAKHKDLDPSIDMTNGIMSPPMVLTKWGKLEGLKASESLKAPEVVVPTDNGANPHRIPQSELEGVELPTLRDDQSAKP